jgi:hypothetical protein
MKGPFKTWTSSNATINEFQKSFTQTKPNIELTNFSFEFLNTRIIHLAQRIMILIMSWK